MCLIEKLTSEVTLKPSSSVFVATSDSDVN